MVTSNRQLGTALDMNGTRGRSPLKAQEQVFSWPPNSACLGEENNPRCQLWENIVCRLCDKGVKQSLREGLELWDFPPLKVPPGDGKPGAGMRGWGELLLGGSGLSDQNQPTS